MSIISGVFTETLVQDLWKKAKDVSMDSRINLQFMPMIDVLKALAQVQGGTLLPGGPGDKENTVRLKWDNFCEIVEDDNTTCEFPATKSSTNTKTYQILRIKSAGFQMSEQDFDNNQANIEEHFAKASLKAEITLLQGFAQYAVAQLNTFAGVNAVTVGLGTVDGTTTKIAPGWNFDVIPYLNRVAILNKLSNPIFLSGNNLYEAWWKAQYQAPDHQTPQNLFNTMKMMFDLFNIDTVNGGDLFSYLVGSGSVAFLNKVYNPTTVETIAGDTQRWSVNSVLFPQFKFDVFKKTMCDTSSTGVDRFITNIKYVLNADIVENPTGCDEDNTNILKFQAVAP